MKMATSELLSTFFPTWLNGGKRDSYWLNPNSHPVLSRYYPVQLCRYVSNKRKIDVAFSSFLYCTLLHYLFSNVGWYLLLGATPLAIFGSITFTYCAFNLKQQPCIVYTLSWFPWLLYGLSTNSIPFSSIAIGMMLLGGYYPVAVYLIPTAALLWFGATSTVSMAIGLLIASPQIIPFIKYLPKTIRGKVEAPSSSAVENQWYFGLTPIILILWAPKWAYLVLLVPFLAMFIKSSLFRVPQRAIVLSLYGAIWFSLGVLNTLSNEAILFLTCIQAFDLWLHNRNLLPPKPFSELWKKPSRAFNNKLTQFLDRNLNGGRVSGLPHPLFTGLVNGHKTMGYCGSMQNNLMWKWRKSFKHDPFIDGVDQDAITRYGVKFSFSYKKLDWKPTGIRNLYYNPNYTGC